jgi:ABC-type phosphate transport system auxiliary subunit
MDAWGWVAVVIIAVVVIIGLLFLLAKMGMLNNNLAAAIQQNLQATHNRQEVLKTNIKQAEERADQNLKQLRINQKEFEELQQNYEELQNQRT